MCNKNYVLKKIIIWFSIIISTFLFLGVSILNGAGIITWSIRFTDGIILSWSGWDDVFITPSWKVGIGTLTPSNKLEVAGKIEANKYCNRNGSSCFSAWVLGSGLHWNDNVPSSLICPNTNTTLYPKDVTIHSNKIMVAYDNVSGSCAFTTGFYNGVWLVDCVYNASACGP